MAKKKKSAFSKFMKKAGKSYAVQKKWIEKHINPDIYTGHTDRIFAPHGMGFGQPPEQTISPPSGGRRCDRCGGSGASASTGAFGMVEYLCDRCYRQKNEMF